MTPFGFVLAAMAVPVVVVLMAAAAAGAHMGWPFLNCRFPVHLTCDTDGCKGTFECSIFRFARHAPRKAGWTYERATGSDLCPTHSPEKVSR